MSRFINAIGRLFESLTLEKSVAEDEFKQYLTEIKTLGEKFKEVLLKINILI